MRLFKSKCEHCEGKTKTETRQGIVACVTCGAEDPYHVPFYEEVPQDKNPKTKLETTEESDSSETLDNFQTFWFEIFFKVCSYNSRKHKPVCATADIVPVLDIKDLFYDPLSALFTKFEFSNSLFFIVFYFEFGRPLEKK